jgi:hypothetical protein
MAKVLLKWIVTPVFVISWFLTVPTAAASNDHGFCSGQSNEDPQFDTVDWLVPPSCGRHRAPCGTLTAIQRRQAS